MHYAIVSLYENIQNMLYIIYIYIHSGQIITTAAEATLNCGLGRESLQNPLNSGLGIILLICPDLYMFP